MDTKNEPRAVETAGGEPEVNSLDRYASYDEGDSVVVCDRKNAKAWLKSDVSVGVER
jgi:hypothetical protein